MKPLICILIVNYRGVSDTLACLRSLKALTYPNFQAVVIDNGSADDSVAVLRETKAQIGRQEAQELPDFHLIVAEENRGFSAGNNLGIDYALTQGAGYVWLLNNDATVESSSLDHLVAEVEKTGGLAGSLLLYPDRSYQQIGTRILWLTGRTRGIVETEIRDGMRVPCLSGASMLIPATVLRRIGKLDESYFLYFEDGEFCLRAQYYHYPCTLALRSRVFHKEGASTGKRSLLTRYYYQRNRLKMLMQYASGVERVFITAYTLFRVVRSLVKAAFGPQDKRADAWVHCLAVSDFIRGVQGRCPHRLEASKFSGSP